MFLYGIPPRRGRGHRVRAIARRLTSAGAAVVVLLLGACGAPSAPDGGSESPSATLSGTVRAVTGAAVLEDAQIRIGSQQVTSDASGQFELTGLPVGAATVRVERSGYLPAEAQVTLSAGANTQDFALSAQTIFVSGDAAVYVPDQVEPLRGVIITLGGPITSGFVTGDRIAPLDKPDLEVSLQELGASLRALARSSHVALFGTSTVALWNDASSDAALFAAIRKVARLSGHPELVAAPVLMVGLSAGGPEAAGLVSRQPERAIGLLERVPTSVTSLTTAAALAVPTFVMQAELDSAVDNAGVRTLSLANRSGGGLWALVVEPWVGHSVATNMANVAMTAWIGTALALRLPATPGDMLVALDEASGWLGNQTTLEIASWADYPDDRTAASWLLSQAVATAWQQLGTSDGRK